MKTGKVKAKVGIVLAVVAVLVLGVVFNVVHWGYLLMVGLFVLGIILGPFFSGLKGGSGGGGDASVGGDGGGG
ncbi:MAG: hypothetical protein F4X65_09840 [Chloroflexi bacterium]|nr:hypothetical protein [Chloroflexota bacterium]